MTRQRRGQGRGGGAGGAGRLNRPTARSKERKKTARENGRSSSGRAYASGESTVAVGSGASRDSGERAHDGGEGRRGKQCPRATRFRQTPTDGRVGETAKGEKSKKARRVGVHKGAAPAKSSAVGVVACIVGWWGKYRRVCVACGLRETLASAACGPNEVRGGGKRRPRQRNRRCGGGSAVGSTKPKTVRGDERRRSDWRTARASRKEGGGVLPGHLPRPESTRPWAAAPRLLHSPASWGSEGGRGAPGGFRRRCDGHECYAPA